MGKNIQTKTQKWTRMEVISAFGVLLTCATLLFGIYTANNNIKAAIVSMKANNMIENTSELPIKVFELTNMISLTTAYKVNDTNEMNEKWKEYADKQNKLLDEISTLVFSYSSEETTKVYYEFFNNLRECVKNNDTNFQSYLESYKKLPLLCSLVKYDLTGEFINPEIVFELYMPSFVEYKDEFKKTTNQYINENSLPKQFIWD